ncbi:hypothetical protein PRZ48_012386 [Zasmidium cellare]|uniref:Uncharacterized protein n=1 Tax=Zasmidium cellare TaxID=395010 RepID=A0ABR0E5A4_ZASCE|nr:hypothetical protein PRZ48_012386 [Zasmidium cellare]
MGFIKNAFASGTGPSQANNGLNQSFMPSFANGGGTLPQITSGDGQPFLRAYSNDLSYYGMTARQFVEVIDTINKAIVPNQAKKVFQSAATVAGFFVPGVDAIALMVGQIGIGAGFSYGHAALIARALSKVNLNVFMPAGLEIGIGKSANVDQELGIPEKSVSPSSPDPESRVAATQGKEMLHQGVRMDVVEDKSVDKRDDAEEVTEELIVKPADPQSVEKWHKTLQQSEAALEKENEKE